MKTNNFRKLTNICLFVVFILALIMVIGILAGVIYGVIEGWDEGDQHKCLVPYAKDYCNLNDYEFIPKGIIMIEGFYCDVPAEEERRKSTQEYFLYSEEELKACGVGE